jgi:alkaline phosphatase D
MDRRKFLIRSGQFAALTLPVIRGVAQAQGRFNSNPFTAGVASGDPLADSLILWTRLMPGEGQDPAWKREIVDVKWRVATDEAMRNVVREGSAYAVPSLGHSVHVDVKGLQPERWYWYQFSVGSEESDIGRSRTAPLGASDNASFNLALAGCQHYEQGFYNAYEHLTREDISAVLFSGDYIYEGAPVAGRPRRHNSAEIITLDDYRARYALYRSDANLQHAHQKFPWIITWDDHEVDNNYANEIPEDSQRREDFLLRRANAYQAFYEWMPMRRAQMPRGPELQLYRSLNYGRLATLHVLDQRQYRSDQPCGDGTKAPCEEWRNPNLTMLGPEQEAWFHDVLTRSTTTWNMVLNELMFTPVDRTAGPGETYSMDQWSGYFGARDRLVNFLAERKPSGMIFLTGDIHSNWAHEVRPDFRNPASPVVAAEFVGTSISSGGDGADSSAAVEAYLPDNPQTKFFNAQRGYLVLNVSRRNAIARYRVVNRVTQVGADVSTRVSFAVEPGALTPQRA